MIKREDWQLEDQAHKMWAEGLQQEEMSKLDIDLALADAGYFAYEIDIYFDDVMQLWGWLAKISKENL